MGAQTARREGVEDAAEIKAMTSQVNWALLGLLMMRPGYGYRLIQQFESYYGDVLPLGSSSHIYTALNELKRRGWIEEVSAMRASKSRTDRQPKVTYQVTAEGARSYRERMLEQAEEDRRRSRLFARQLAVFEREPDVALRILDHQEKAYLRETTRTPGAAWDDDDDGSLPDSSSGLADRLVSEEGRLTAECKLPWVEYARSEFKALKGGTRR